MWIYDTITEDWIDAEETQDFYDPPMGNPFAVDDWCALAYHHQSERWYPCEFVQWRSGTLAGALAQGGSASVTIAGGTVTAYDLFLASGDSLPSGAAVGITWDAENTRWVVTQTTCS